jgi:hypothetical protein
MLVCLVFFEICYPMDDASPFERRQEGFVFRPPCFWQRSCGSCLRGRRLRLTKHVIASKTFVDLTHAFGPDSPVWSGFGQARMSPAIDPKTRKPYTIEKDGFRATELKKSDGDYHIAFRNHEQLFHPLITRKQRAAERFSGSFAPKTRFGIFVRNQVILRRARAKIQDQPPHFRRVSAKTGPLTPAFSGERASSSGQGAKSRKPRRRALRPSKYRSRCCCQTPCPPKTGTATHRSDRARF